MNYVSGILIDWQLDLFLLARKTSSIGKGKESLLEFENKWNSVGGKIEKRIPGYDIEYGIPRKETPHEAMVREFKEETGLSIATSRWTCFHIKQFSNGNKCYFFVAFGDEPKKYRMPDATMINEEIRIHSYIDVCFNPEWYQPDLSYILHMLISEARRGAISSLDPEGVNSAR